MEIIRTLNNIIQMDDYNCIKELTRQLLSKEIRNQEYTAVLKKHSKERLMFYILDQSAASNFLGDRNNNTLETNLIKSGIASRLHYIFRLDNLSFIREIYKEFLCREPNQTELIRDNQLLNTGVSRYSFLRNNIMTYSEECRSILQGDIELGKFHFNAHSKKPMDYDCKSSGLSLQRKVSVIVLTWNGLKHTRKFLDSLRETADDDKVDVIVFDNGSTDGTVEYLKSISWIKPIFNSTNIGFTAGNNNALQHCDPQSDVVLLNNDMVIEQTDWLNLLQETAYTEDKNGIVGCRLVNEEGKLLHAGTFIYPETLMGMQIGGMELDINQYNSIQDVQGIVFACAYIKREVINRIGFLDTSFFAYYEDTDYCFHALTNGYKIVMDGRVTLIHHHNGSTKENNVSFWDIYNPSKKIFSDKWYGYLKTKDSLKVNWTSSTNLPFHGYSESSKNLMLALDNNNVNVSYRYAYGPGSPIGMNEPEGKDYRQNIYKSRNYHEGGTEVVYARGDVFSKNRGKYKIGYTMLEVDGLPTDWVNQCNLMNEVWVPAQFNVQTFKRSGVKVPIHVIPLGIDPNYFNPEIVGSRFSEKFTFLTVFEWGARKNPEKLLRSFFQAFPDKNDVLLVCKITNNNPTFDLLSEIRKLNLGDIGSKLLILNNQTIDSYLMGSLYRSVDCFVLPTSGEGWGMPILEAMACGIPTIATDWSAQKTFLNEQTGYPIRVKKLIPAPQDTPFYKGFNWAEPDTEHLIHLMRHVYENREEAKIRSSEVANEIVAKWTWDNSAKHIVNRLKSIRL